MPETIKGWDRGMIEPTSDLEGSGNYLVAPDETGILLVITPEGMPGFTPGKLKERRCTCHFRNLDKRHSLPISQPIRTHLGDSTDVRCHSLRPNKSNRQSRVMGPVVDDVVVGGSHVSVSFEGTLDL